MTTHKMKWIEEKLFIRHKFITVVAGVRLSNYYYYCYHYHVRRFADGNCMQCIVSPFLQ